MEDPTDFSIFVKDNEKWSQTESVSLISSFVVSLLVGTYAPIDFSDGSGMNVLDHGCPDRTKILLVRVGPGWSGIPDRFYFWSGPVVRNSGPTFIGPVRWSGIPD